jgi:uncharacterized protein (DUF2235 family)
MGKNIIVCADGTWNGPGQDENADGVPDGTNVLKLFCNLKGAVTLETAKLENEQEKVVIDERGRSLQVAKYLHGVGDSGNALKHLLGGVFGAGVIDRVVRGYTYVSRNYEPGDDIYVVGFSRGAYTARALGGMIMSVGLLNKDTVDLSDDGARYKLGIGAWVKYRERSRHIESPLFSYLLDFVGCDVKDAQLRTDVPIRAMGVWDTVGAYGVPAYAMDSRRIDLFRFADCKLNPRVRQGFHAVSIDERRADFTPTLWDEPAPNVSQVWFSGSHADVGGGYPQSGLSDIALEWMCKQLEEAGVLFAAPAVYQWKCDAKIAQHTPWAQPPWNVIAASARAVPAGAYIHGSVVSRGNYNLQALQNVMKNNALDPARCKIVQWES